MFTFDKYDIGSGNSFYYSAIWNVGMALYKAFYSYIRARWQLFICLTLKFLQRNQRRAASLGMMYMIQWYDGTSIRCCIRYYIWHADTVSIQLSTDYSLIHVDGNVQMLADNWGFFEKQNSEGVFSVDILTICYILFRKIIVPFKKLQELSISKWVQKSAKQCDLNSGDIQLKKKVYNTAKFCVRTPLHQ